VFKIANGFKIAEKGIGQASIVAREEKIAPEEK
jgi:hypothetical protein